MTGLIEGKFGKNFVGWLDSTENCYSWFACLFRPRSCVWDFFGGGGGGGGGVIFGPGIFWAFDFCSHSNIHVTLNREYPLKLAVVKALFALLINKIRTTVIKKNRKN